jgi:hypothetical protein
MLSKMRPVDIWRNEPATVVSLCSCYTREPFLSGTLTGVNIGNQPERAAVVHVVPVTAIMSRPHQWHSPRSVSKTCPAQNEEFFANKAKGIDRRQLVAIFDPGGFRNLDFTRATVALAMQKKGNDV